MLVKERDFTFSFTYSIYKENVVMNHLFRSFSFKGLELKNRIVMSPMCQYSAVHKDGQPTDWHFFHYTSRAIGGAGMIIVEMTLVEPEGRSTDYDLGIWSDEHIPAFARIVEACHQYGAKIAIQIGHAGRKAEDAINPVAPSAIPYDSSFKVPKTLTIDEIKELVEKFRLAAKRAVLAGFDAIEIHGAHGYLIHQFHSRLINHRKDEYGKDLTKFGSEVIKAMRSEMPSIMPLLMRISAREYTENGYDINDSIDLCKKYQKAGVDIFDISSGGEGPMMAQGKSFKHLYDYSEQNPEDAVNRPSFHEGYQVPLAHEIKKALNIPVIAVGKLGDPKMANSVIGNDYADLVAVGRSMLRNPNWALDAAVELGEMKSWYGAVERYKNFTATFHKKEASSNLLPN